MRRGQSLCWPARHLGNWVGEGNLKLIDQRKLKWWGNAFVWICFQIFIKMSMLGCFKSESSPFHHQAKEELTAVRTVPKAISPVSIVFFFIVCIDPDSYFLIWPLKHCATSWRLNRMLHKLILWLMLLTRCQYRHCLFRLEVLEDPRQKFKIWILRIIRVI